MHVRSVVETASTTPAAYVQVVGGWKERGAFTDAIKQVGSENGAVLGRREGATGVASVPALQQRSQMFEKNVWASNDQRSNDAIFPHSRLSADCPMTGACTGQ